MAIMLLVVFVDLMGFGVVIPLLPFYATHFHASALEVTGLLATYSGLQLVSAPLWGRVSDRIGRRPMMLLSLATSVWAYLWLTHADALWMLFAARALQGISAGNISICAAYIADITSPENRARGMGLMGAAFGLGFIVGPAIGGQLAGSSPTDFDVALPAYAAAGLSALALVLAVSFLKESLPPDRRASKARQPSRLAQITNAFGRKRLRLLIALSFVLTFAFAGMETTFGLFALSRFGWGPRPVGEVFATVGLVLVLIQGGLTGRLTKRFGEARLLLAGNVAIGVGLLLLGLSYAPPLAILASSLLAFGMAMASPSINSLVSKEASATEQGSILGVNQSMSSLARLLGPLFAGLLFQSIDPGAPYLVGAGLLVVSSGLAVLVIRQGGTPAASIVRASTAAGPTPPAGTLADGDMRLILKAAETR